MHLKMVETVILPNCMMTSGGKKLNRADDSLETRKLTRVDEATVRVILDCIGNNTHNG